MTVRAGQRRSCAGSGSSAVLRVHCSMSASGQTESRTEQGAVWRRELPSARGQRSPVCQAGRLARRLTGLAGDGRPGLAGALGAGDSAPPAGPGPVPAQRAGASGHRDRGPAAPRTGSCPVPHPPGTLGRRPVEQVLDGGGGGRRSVRRLALAALTRQRAGPAGSDLAHQRPPALLLRTWPGSTKRNRRGRRRGVPIPAFASRLTSPASGETPGSLRLCVNGARPGRG